MVLGPEDHVGCGVWVEQRPNRQQQVGFACVGLAHQRAQRTWRERDVKRRAKPAHPYPLQTKTPASEVRQSATVAV